MEAEIRAILIESVQEPVPPVGPFVALLERFSEVGGVELELPPREPMRRVPDFSE